MDARLGIGLTDTAAGPFTTVRGQRMIACRPPNPGAGRPSLTPQLEANERRAMPPRQWNPSLTDIGAALSALPRDGSGPVLWATEAVDGLHYLDDLDRDAFADSAGLRGFNKETIEITHVRWAATLAVSSVDLCAAALMRIADIPSRRRWGDMHSLLAKQGTLAFRALTPLASRWLDSVTSDSRYHDLRAARVPSVHGTMGRALGRVMGAPDYQQPRTGFRPHGPDTEAIVSRDLIVMAKTFGGEYVQWMLAMIGQQEV